MPALKPVTIVGGGLAGLTLGIGLRREGVPATVWEAGHYPRHRVCGEFISGNGQEVLRRLGLIAAFEEAGAFHARTAVFVCGSNRSPVRRLSPPALCLSRHDMDALLARHFEQLGGELRTDSRWTADDAEGVVRASGRRAQATEKGWRWFGLKAHVTEVNLDADLEMHVSSVGYVGVNRVNRGEVNVCGLFRARAGDSQADSRRHWLRGQPGSPLSERLGRARFDEASFCSVAGLSLKPRRAAPDGALSIGDALTMIPPVTGNGMSMAFESAELAIEPVAAFSRGEMTWAQARAAVARACDTAFARRLAWARLLQWLMFSPLMRSAPGGMLLRSDRLWQFLFANTR